MLKNLRIRAQILLLITVLTTGLFLYGIISYFTIEKIRIEGPYYKEIIKAKDLIADILPPPAYIIEAYLLSFQEYIEKDPSQLQGLIERSQTLEKDYQKTHAKWYQNLDNPDIRPLFLETSDEYVSSFFYIWNTQYLPALLEGNKERAFAILTGPLSEKYQQHRKVVDKMVELANYKYGVIENDIRNYYSDVRVLSFVAWIGLLVLGWVFGWWILQRLSTQLLKISENLESIAFQVNASSDQQAQATVQQSSAVNETTTTMDELNASFQHTQAIAQDASERSKNAVKVCDSGNENLSTMVKNLSIHKEQVGQIVEHIMRLSQLTRQIHNIASVTSNLTNQTNILALNAAVQAAHVKQYGEGFSVIAGEIRKLADESKKFLSHIDVLSENIQQATDATIKIVDEGHKKIQEIINTSEGVSSIFHSLSEISTSSFEGAQQTSLNVKEQAVAVQQVLHAMENLNEGSQQAIQGMQQVRFEITRLNDASLQLKSFL